MVQAAGLVSPDDEAFVRRVIARETIAALAALPPDWAEQDLTAMYAEYNRLCREAHERGEAVAEWLKSAREAAK